MRTFLFSCLGSLSVIVLLFGCVDAYELDSVSTLNVITVDGTLSDLPEAQFIKLGRSKADQLTGLFGDRPISGAKAEVVVDGTQTIAFNEKSEGTYFLPDGFKGEAGHTYQLKFQLNDGTRYASSTETMPAGSTITKIYQQFNAQSLPVTQLKGYTSANDVYIDYQDPADKSNYYRWEWTLWERQDWCSVGQYQDLPCTQKCWEILKNYDIDVADDRYSNGRAVTGKRVARVPYYQDVACLIEVRQSSLNSNAYRYYKLMADQTQSTGTLTDTPPAAPAGNIRNTANDKEVVVGYFTASSVHKIRYQLHRNANAGTPIGLFKGLYGKSPVPGRTTSPCILSDTRTPIQPEDWPD